MSRANIREKIQGLGTYDRTRSFMSISKAKTSSTTEMLIGSEGQRLKFETTNQTVRFGGKLKATKSPGDSFRPW